MKGFQVRVWDVPVPVSWNMTQVASWVNVTTEE